MSPSLDIVDQSNNNGALTPLDGLQGYAHKMSEGHTYYDRFAAGRLRGAVTLGLRYVIGYHVLRAGATSGADQANWYLDCCVDAGFDPSARGSITMNDWEGWDDGFATRTQAMDFAERVNSLTGRESVIHYGGLPNPYDMGGHIWLADYRNAAPALNRLFPKTAVWQWGNKAPGGGDTNQIIDSAWLDHLAGYDAPIEPTEVDMDFFVYQCADADAAFLGLSTPAGIVPWVEWLSAGRKAQYRSDGLAEKSAMVAGFVNCTLIGSLPQGDSRHTWVASDFAQTSPAGPKGDKGDPGSVPHGTFPATVTIG